MVKRWVITATVNPPAGTVSGRYGGSVMFVAYNRFLRHWILVGGGREEVVGEPAMILVEEDWARANRNLERLKAAPKIPLAIRKKRSEQLTLF